MALEIAISRVKWPDISGERVALMIRAEVLCTDRGKMKRTGKLDG